jgi:hypothetical protein
MGSLLYFLSLGMAYFIESCCSFLVICIVGTTAIYKVAPSFLDCSCRSANDSSGPLSIRVKFQDETLRDEMSAEAAWLAGKQSMRVRMRRQQFTGRPVQPKYREL